MKKITAIGNRLVQVITGVLAAVFLIYGVLMLWDMYRTDMKAFATYDLLKYRPNIEDDEPPYLDDLVEINPDTAAWITLYDTNIDYPVMQGKDDTEYINKDAYGEYSISGSIFMAAKNSKDFSDPYTLVYGHHMANGSMFGDILKFKNKGFFDRNDTGVLIMSTKVYDLKVMACLETDAYDHNVYWSDKEETDSFMSYLKSSAKYYREEPYERLLALSTCDDATTSGRTVLVCAMTTRKKPLPDREYGKPIPHRQAVGHPMAGAYWALLNLLCLVLTIYCVLKANIRKSRFLLLKQKNKRTIRIMAAESIVLAAAVILFIATENMHKPIQITDVWTLPMIILLGLVWLTERWAYSAAQTKSSTQAESKDQEIDSDRS